MGATAKRPNGEGSVFPVTTKSGTTVWKAQVTLGRTPNGNPRRTTRTAPTRHEAQKLLRTLLKQRDDGLLSQITNETVATLGIHWARDIKPQHVRTSTASGYEDILRRYVNPVIGSIRFCDLTARDVQHMITSLRASGKSASTVNQTRRILNGLCNWACKQGIIAHNPVAATEPVRKQIGDTTQVREPWSQQELFRALHASENDDTMDCFVHLMVFTGLRPGEALGLRWCDIDLDARTLSVTGTLREERRIMPDGQGVVRSVRNDPKTFHSRRTLTIHPGLFWALNRQQQRQIDWRTAAGDTWQDSGYVICSRVGTLTNASNNRKQFYRFLSDAGIRQIRCHDLRHVVARTALEADVRIEHISQAFGHTRIDTTKQIYAGYVPHLNDQFTERLGDYLSTGVQDLTIADTTTNVTRPQDCEKQQASNNRHT